MNISERLQLALPEIAAVLRKNRVYTAAVIVAGNDESGSLEGGMVEMFSKEQRHLFAEHLVRTAVTAAADAIKRSHQPLIHEQGTIKPI